MVDLIVIGAGSGGLAAAKRAAAYGKNVILVENDTIGGTCVSYGCVPKKLWHAISMAKHQFDLAQENGWKIRDKQFHWNQIQPKLLKYIQSLNQRHETKCRELNIKIINGKATFENEKTIKVNNQLFSAKHILVAVGGKAKKINIPGSIHTETSYDFFSWKEQPDSVLIWGGGYIAVELASILNALGTKVHLVIRQPLILRGFDHKLREFIQDKMIKRGIIIHTETSLKGIHIEKNKKVCKLDNDNNIAVEKVLQAVGRIPNTEKLNCNSAKIELDKHGGIIIDNNFQTSSKNIYALGDCINQVQLTPVAIAQARKWVDFIFNKKAFPVDFSHIPTAVFSHPEAAYIGLSEEEANTKYNDIKIKEMSFNPLTSALATNSKEPVLMKVVFQGKHMNIIGIHLACEGAAEIIQSLAIAFQKGITKSDLDMTMALHPTLTEELVTIY
ncbi:MAG: glutathione-disulfide reductase [Candidatus Margulisiibacteriota bacterium]